MDNIKTQIAALAIFAIVCIAATPIYFMRRRTQNMADAVLNRINPADWKKQILFRARITFISRLLGGVLIAGGLAFKYEFINYRTGGFLILALLVGAASLIVSAFYGYRTDMRKLIEV